MELLHSVGLCMTINFTFKKKQLQIQNNYKINNYYYYGVQGGLEIIENKYINMQMHNECK